jgi:hypothetical protein
LVRLFKRVNNGFKSLAIMGTRRKLFKVFRLGKAKHALNWTKKYLRK